MASHGPFASPFPSNRTTKPLWELACKRMRFAQALSNIRLQASSHSGFAAILLRQLTNHFVGEFRGAAAPTQVRGDFVPFTDHRAQGIAQALGFAVEI